MKLTHGLLFAGYLCWNLATCLTADAEPYCPRCYEIKSIIGKLSCLYDAQVLGCDKPIVRSLIYDDGAMYSETVVADADLQCLDVVDFLGNSMFSSSKGIKGKSGKSSKSMSNNQVSKCEDVGGVCIVYCDVTSDDYECLTGLCDVDLVYDEPVPVLTFDRFFTGCSCKVPM